MSDCTSDVCSSDLIVLALTLGACVYLYKGNFGRLREQTAGKSTGWRRRRNRIWIAKAFVLFAGPALLGLALLGRLDALAVLPGEFGRLAVAAGYPLPIGWPVLEVLAGPFFGGFLGDTQSFGQGKGGACRGELGGRRFRQNKYIIK